MTTVVLKWNNETSSFKEEVESAEIFEKWKILAEEVREGVYSLPIVALIETADKVMPAVIEGIEEISEEPEKNFVKIVFRRPGDDELFTEFINFQNPKVKLRLAKDSRNKLI